MLSQTSTKEFISAVGSRPPRVTIVMPIKNEASYLSAALDAIASQDYPRELIELIVVDGGSTDASTQVVENQRIPDLPIRIAGGPGVNCPAGMNIGIGLAHGELIAKVDGHGFVNPEFIRTAATYLAAHPETGCVGGRVIPILNTNMARANALARFSIFGVGGGVYTLSAQLRETDSVQCGVYRRAALEDVGGFDPTLQFGEDEELNYRIRRRGWRIVFHPDMHFHYYMRPTLGSLFRQYRGYGTARLAVVRKHPSFLRVKHLVPAALVMALGASLIAGLVSPILRPMAASVWGGYAAFVGIGAAVLSARARFVAPHRVAASLIALHIGYGLGLLRGLWPGFNRR